MANITFKMKDGTKREFRHEGRPGGSYTKRLSFDGEFAIVTDEYYRRTCIPAAEIAEIIEEPDRGYW